MEDSPVQAERLRATLAKYKFEVSLAQNGKEGLAKARSENPALILSDVVMPVMDGYEMCRQIKQDVALAETPVVMLTVLADSIDIIHGMNAGADYYLVKPCEEEYLLYRLRGILARQRPAVSDGEGDLVTITLDGQSHRAQVFT